MATRPKGFVPDYHGERPPRPSPNPGPDAHGRPTRTAPLVGPQFSPLTAPLTDAVNSPRYGNTDAPRGTYKPPTPRQLMDRRMATPPVFSGNKPELPDFDPSVDTFIGVSKDLSSIERNRALVPGLKQGSRK